MDTVLRILLKLSAETLQESEDVALRAFKLLQDVASSGANLLADVHRGTETVLSRLKKGIIFCVTEDSLSGVIYSLEYFTRRQRE